MPAPRSARHWPRPTRRPRDYLDKADRVRRPLLRLQPADTAARRARRPCTAVAASRRLDDAFRSYLAERGAKPVPLAGVTSLVTGVAALRLTADAVLDLWQRDQHQAEGDRTAASAELVQSSVRVNGWYDELAASLSDRARGAGSARA